MNNISFQGRINVYEWTNIDKYVERTFTTTKAQDKLIKQVADNFTKEVNDVHVPQRKLQFLHQLLEKITGTKIKNLNNEKEFYNGGNYISYKDNNCRLLNGIEVFADFE